MYINVNRWKADSVYLARYTPLLAAAPWLSSSTQLRARKRWDSRSRATKPPPSLPAAELYLLLSEIFAQLTLAKIEMSRDWQTCLLLYRYLALRFQHSSITCWTQKFPTALPCLIGFNYIRGFHVVWDFLHALELSWRSAGALLSLVLTRSKQSCAPIAKIKSTLSNFLIFPFSGLRSNFKKCKKCQISLPAGQPFSPGTFSYPGQHS